MVMEAEKEGEAVGLVASVAAAEVETAEEVMEAVKEEEAKVEGRLVVGGVAASMVAEQEDMGP